MNRQFGSQTDSIKGRDQGTQKVLGQNGQKGNVLAQEGLPEAKGVAKKKSNAYPDRGPRESVRQSTAPGPSANHVACSTKTPTEFSIPDRPTPP
jgi:hypothetical protein